MIRTIAWVVGIISFFVFIALFGRLPVFRKTPIGFLHRMLLQHLPRGLMRMDEIITGKRLTNTVMRCYRYLMHDRHPVVMIIFIALQLGSEMFFLPPAAQYLPRSHKLFIIPLLVSLPYLTLWLSYNTSAHHITETSYQAALTRYPYDYTLYHPHQNCRTCERPKPARSKHCPICKTCMERQDHHCIWINNCVGLHNYHYFVALLVTVAMLLGYGAWTGFKILETILQDMVIPPELTRGSLSSKRWSTSLGWGQWLNMYSIAIAQNARIGAVSLLASMTFPLALGFLAYHCYLIWAGCTTNETAKWADLREDIWDRLVWRAQIIDVKSEYPGPLDHKIVYDAQHHRDQKSMTGVAPSWADGKEAEWWVIRTRQGGQPTRMLPIENGQYKEIADDRWFKVVSLKGIDNLYDLGLWGNFNDTVLAGWKR